jgi:hypothetical protein
MARMVGGVQTKILNPVPKGLGIMRNAGFAASAQQDYFLHGYQ